jgi:hypothetical protein
MRDGCANDEYVDAGEKQDRRSVEQNPPDPYGGVPLGVECAWPDALGRCLEDNEL